MTIKSSNSIESLLRLPFHIFLFQYKKMEGHIKAIAEKK